MASASRRGAEEYDRWFERPWGRYALSVELGAVLRAAANLGAVARVLDAGCGTGRFGAALAGRGTVVVGVDPDAAALAIAASRLDHCARAVLERLPFPDGTFDATLAVTVLELVSDAAEALAELARVTRRGGRVVVGALNPRSPWGLAHRRRLRSGDWCEVRFLDRGTLASLGAAHGRSRLDAVLYAPGSFPGLARVGGAAELLGKLVPRLGAFQVLTIDLP